MLIVLRFCLVCYPFEVLVIQFSILEHASSVRGRQEVPVAMVRHARLITYWWVSMVRYIKTHWWTSLCYLEPKKSYLSLASPTWMALKISKPGDVIYVSRLVKFSQSSDRSFCQSIVETMSCRYNFWETLAVFVKTFSKDDRYLRSWSWSRLRLGVLGSSC